MHTAPAIKPTHAALQTYYQKLQSYSDQQITHEGATETAFSQLLADTAKPRGWMLVPKLPVKRGGKSIIPDGTLRDQFNLHRVEKMKLTKDKSAVIVNPSLTLAGIPPATFNYRLGNRSALDWLIDQYQVSIDKRSFIRSDPNRPDDPQYIVRLLAQVVRLSLETVRIVEALPGI